MARLTIQEFQQRHPWVMQPRVGVHLGIHRRHASGRDAFGGRARREIYRAMAEFRSSM
jgi:hypothetical protein